jgi:hypothetical protein
MEIPTFIKPGVWECKDILNDWHYRMSLDGHIFKTSDIYPLIHNLSYNDPNSLEAALDQNPIRKPLMACLPESVILNIPWNRVQEYNNNRHGGVGANFLNSQYLTGKRISLKSIIGIKNMAAHQEVPLEWE